MEESSYKKKSFKMQKQLKKKKLLNEDDLKEKKKQSKNKNCTKVANINLSYSKEEFVHYCERIWKAEKHTINSDLQDFSELTQIKGLKIMHEPFKWGFLPQIIQNEQLLQGVNEELKELKVHQKNNDLYKFKCTGDLNKEGGPNIQLLCKYIKGPIKAMLQRVTGIALNDKVSISCSMYEYSDVLLCHDDELEGRRIAFILYLVSDWSKSYGGSLDLFSVDRYNRPFCIAERICPEFNSFAFFEVSPVSFHQVSEVVVQDKTRISINGWFHGEPIRYPSRYVVKPPLYRFPGFVEEHVLYAWVNPLYLDQNSQAEIRKDFQERSEIQLSNFLKTKKYKPLSEALRRNDLKWKWVGPPYKKNLELMSRRDLPAIVEEYICVMQSEAMFLILSQLTGLELHHLGPKDDLENTDEDLFDNEFESKKGTEIQKEISTDDVPRDSLALDNENKQSNEINLNSKKKRKRNKSEKTKLEKKKLLKLNSMIDLPIDCDLGLSQGWESDVDRDIQDNNAAAVNANTKAEITSEVRRWRWGSYSLMRDDDLNQNKDFILDAMYFCNGSRNWQLEYGGSTVYVAKGEKDELLSVVPLPNSLMLVYRDKETFKFTKHINIKSKQLPHEESVFNEIYFEYREKINK